MIYFLRLLRFKFRLIFFLPVPAALYFMHLASEITYYLARLTPIRKKVIYYFQLVFPSANHSDLADKLLKNVAYAIFEIICAPFFKQRHLDRIIKVVGLENLDLALAQRKGAICLSLHSGNYELTAAVLASRGYHLTTVMKSPPGDQLYQFLNRSRLYRGSRLINILDGDMYRACLRELAKQRCVGILVDTGAMEGRHEMMPFLGHQVPIATGWTALAQRSGAPVVPFFSKREGQKVVFTIGQHYTIDRNNKAEVMEIIRDFYERMIKAHPDQWAIFLNEHEVKRMLGKQ